MRRDLRQDESPPFTQMSAGYVCQKRGESPAHPLFPCRAPRRQDREHLRTATRHPPQETCSVQLDIPSPFLLGLWLLKVPCSQRMSSVASTWSTNHPSSCSDSLHPASADIMNEHVTSVYSFHRRLVTTMFGQGLGRTYSTVQTAVSGLPPGEQNCPRVGEEVWKRAASRKGRQV